MTNTPLEKGYYSRNEVAVDYSYSIGFWRLKEGWLTGFMVFIVLYAQFCLMCILVNLWWYLLILQILAAWAYLNTMVIVVNLVKHIWFVALYCLLMWFCVCWVSIWVFPPLSAMIAARRRGMLATRCCGHSTVISVQLSDMAWRSSPRFWGGLSMLVIAWPNSSQICSMELQSGDLGDIGLPEEFKDNPSTGKCGVIVLVTLVIPKMLSGKWH